MLYFTFPAKNSSEKIGGTFSGRFSFKNKVHLDDDSANDLIKKIQESRIADYGEELTHEKIHHLICQYSDLNRYLIGMRFFARFDFYKGNYLLVQKYYHQRTIYFLFSYHLHEYLVDRIEKKNKDRDFYDRLKKKFVMNSFYPKVFSKGLDYSINQLTKLIELKFFKQDENKKYREKISKVQLYLKDNLVLNLVFRKGIDCLEDRIIKLVKVMGFDYFSNTRKIISFILGCIATRTFTSILAVKKDENTNNDNFTMTYDIVASSNQEGYLSKYLGFNVNGGIEVITTDSYLTRIYKRFLKFFNLERFFKVNWSDEMLIAWTYNKFFAEYWAIYTLLEFNNNHKIDDKKIKTLLFNVLNENKMGSQNFDAQLQEYFKKYLLKILEFAVSGYYLKISDAIINDLNDIVDDLIHAICEQKSIDDFLYFLNVDDNKEKKKILGQAGNFFYYHGN